MVVFVQSGCRYCAQEMSFYRELLRVQAATGAYQLVFAGYESVDLLRAYLDRNGLSGATAVTVASVPGLAGTPTILIQEPDGRVVRSWQGVLSPVQKAELRKLL